MLFVSVSLMFLRVRNISPISVFCLLIMDSRDHNFKDIEVIKK